MLLNNEKVDPSEDKNYSLRYALSNGHNDIVELLFNDKRVQNTLKNDNKNLYNRLKTKYIKNKVENF